MIFDTIHHVDLYDPPSRVLRKAFDFIQNNKLSFARPRKYEIGNLGIYALPQEYIVKRKEEKSIESHRKYIDIQVMMEGREYLGYAEKNTLQSLEYTDEHDVERLTGTLTFIPFYQDFFAVLFSQDAHMPGVEGQGSTQSVKKIVIKVPVNLW